MDASLTKNQNIALRIASAKQFLADNPTESKAVASRIYGLNPKTLIGSIRRNPTGGKQGGHNAILKPHEIKAVYQFIRSLLLHDIPPSYEVVFGAILSLKRAHNPENKGPTKR